MDKREKKPSVYTEIYWLIEDGKITAENLIAFLELYWPTFIKKDNYVFLKEKFSEEAYIELLHKNSNPEYWINILTIDDFFSDSVMWREKSLTLVKALIEMWQAKLKKDFPTMYFTVEYLYDQESGDYGLTFYQKSCR